MIDQTEDRAFNLIHTPWLPIRRRSGAREHIAPSQITDRIQEDPVTAFAWPRPDFDGAAHEFIIGLLSTSAAPKDDEAWADWWSHPPTPEVLEQQFERVARAFDLDGPGPRFMQDLDPLEDSPPKDVSALLIDAPGVQTLRNNADLFVKRDVTSVLCRATAAMALHTLNTYAPSGGAGHRTSLRGGGPMTTLVIAAHKEHGDTLWGRIWPNVETKEQIWNRAGSTFPSLNMESIFPWLVPTRTSDPKRKGRSTSPSDVHPLHVYWAMPRRIRLIFEDAAGRACGMTSDTDSAVVSRYRTQNYGSDYTNGFEHPLTPYYRQKSGIRKPVHPKLGGISYRLWPGIVVSSSDKLCDPAQTIRHADERARSLRDTRITVFGYDMDSMKARSWIDAEMPLWLIVSDDKRGFLNSFIQRTTNGAGTVASQLERAIKVALHGRPSKVSGNYDFISERFYRETETDFLLILADTVEAIEENMDAEDPSERMREKWAQAMAEAALHLFDEYAPAEGLESRNMRRHVEARFHLSLTLRGYRKVGRNLFEKDLGIQRTTTAREHKEGKIV